MIENQRNSFHRVVDAALNRAAEGLRVSEDVCRMHLEDPSLTNDLKQLRHELGQLGQAMLPENSTRSRDSETDIGRTIQTSDEYTRTTDPESSNYSGLVTANFKRVQQAVRTLEEFAKLSNAPLNDAIAIAKRLEQVRYRSYSLEKSVLATLSSTAIIGSPSIYVLIDGQDLSQFCSAEGQACELETSKFAESVRQLVAAEVDWIQLRDKQLSDRQLTVAGRFLRQSTSGTKTRFIFNDRVDLALLVRADGVHVGQEELTVSQIRKIAGPELLVGVSTHSITQAKAAVAEGADYIGVGPVFPSATKSFEAHVGTALIQQMIDEVRLPAFAIGGIDLNNVADVVAAGCRRVAVSHVFLGIEPEHYIATAEKLRAALCDRN